LKGLSGVSLNVCGDRHEAVGLLRLRRAGRDELQTEDVSNGLPAKSGTSSGAGHCAGAGPRLIEGLERFGRGSQDLDARHLEHRQLHAGLPVHPLLLDSRCLRAQGLAGIGRGLRRHRHGHRRHLLFTLSSILTMRDRAPPPSNRRERCRGGLGFRDGASGRSRACWSLRANGLVDKLPHSRHYRLLPNGYSICLVFLKLFERV
jgi:hypothetical protein